MQSLASSSVTPLSIEPLESRIAPAVILEFTDNVDGDTVKLLSDKALTAAVSYAPNGSVAEILITGAGLDGASLTTVVTKSANGDGLVNIGRIMATGIDLGVVTVKGDLGKIVSGNASNPLPGLKGLKVLSLGAFGTATQGTGNLISQITGDIGAVTVTGDLHGNLRATGVMGTVKIGGDVRGGDESGSGRLLAVGFKSVSIGGDLVAGEGDESGKVVSSGNLGMLMIRGSVYGARDMTADELTAQIDITGKAGNITIGRDVFGGVSEQKFLEVTGDAGAITVKGSIFGGAGKLSGAIKVTGKTGLLTIGRDIRGSGGDFAATIVVNGFVGGFKLGGSLFGGPGLYQDGVRPYHIELGGSTGPIVIGGSIIADTGRGSGTVLLGTSAPSLFIGGSIIGGGTETPNVFPFPGGSVAIGDVKKVTIGGDLRESAFGGGGFLGGNIGSFLLKGSVFAAQDIGTSLTGNRVLSLGSVGTARIEGSIYGSADFMGNQYTVGIATVKKLDILGSLIGFNGGRGGAVLIGGDATSVTVKGSLFAGAGGGSGNLEVTGKIGTLNVSGVVTSQVISPSIGKVTIRGDLIGSLQAANGFGSITLGGSVLGGSIISNQSLGVVKIGGSVSSGGANGTFTLNANRATSIAIAGDVLGNAQLNAGVFYFGGSAGVVTIGGDLRSTTSIPAQALFAVGGGDGFTSFKVKGDVSNAIIGAGLQNFLQGTNADARLGIIEIGGNFIASSIVAGVVRGADGDYGTGDDAVHFSPNGTPEVSTIAAVTIRGQAIGTSDMNDHYGIVAQKIGPVKVGLKTYIYAAAPIELDPVFDEVKMLQL